jgi:hypothetical protein
VALLMDQCENSDSKQAKAEVEILAKLIVRGST